MDTRFDRLPIGLSESSHVPLTESFDPETGLIFSSNEDVTLTIGMRTAIQILGRRERGDAKGRTHDGLGPKDAEGLSRYRGVGRSAHADTGAASPAPDDRAGIIHTPGGNA